MTSSAQAQGGAVAEPWVSVDEVAAHLGVDSKRMPAHKFGKPGKFKLSEIDEWVRSGGASEPRIKQRRPARRSKKR